MSFGNVVEGHAGNLTPEQEDKLRQLWAAILKLCGTQGVGPDGPAEAQPPGSSLPPAELETTQKRRFSLFRRKNPDGPVPAPASHTSDVRDEIEDDKYGQMRQFQEILAKWSPQDIRAIIWSMVKQDDPDSLVLRFLRARKWNVDKALVMLVSAMNWRSAEMNVDTDIMKNGEGGAVHDEIHGDSDTKKLASDFMAQARMGKSFLHGTDKQERPICIVRVRLHKPNAQSPEGLERYTVHLIETARLTLQPPVDTATIVFDMSGFSLANLDYRAVKFIIQCFEANYPESLGAILVHNAPWVFHGIWKVIRGWLDPVVAAKVHFTNYRAGLEEFIDPSHIIKELEGDEDWEYQYEEPEQGENDIMKDGQTRERLLRAREELQKDFELQTLTWIRSPALPEGHQAAERRRHIAEQMRRDYWKLDPYLRSRSLYDRQGNIQPGGSVDWYRRVAKPDH